MNYNILDFYIDRQFMEFLNQEVINKFNLAPTFLLGNRGHTRHIRGCLRTSGFRDALEQVCEKLNRKGLIEYLKGLDPIKYNWTTNHITFTCARQFHLYAPKTRWRTIFRIDERI